MSQNLSCNFFSWCVDGVNCINVYSNSSTEIGKFYSNFKHSPFTCEDGYFASIEAYWYYIITDGKSPKNTYGIKAKQEGKRYPRVKEIDKEKIKKAIDIKLKNNFEFIKNNDTFVLMLVHYYDYGDKRINGGHEWVIEHLELRRKQLKNYINNKNKNDDFK